MAQYWLLLLFFLTTAPIPIAMAAPGDLCYEDIDDMCGLFTDPFTALLTPLNTVITVDGQGLALVLLWGVLLGIIWFKTENIMLLGIVGIIVSVTITGFYEPARGVGMLLLAVAIGITMFQLIRQRISVLQ